MLQAANNLMAAHVLHHPTTLKTIMICLNLKWYISTITRRITGFQLQVIKHLSLSVCYKTIISAQLILSWYMLLLKFLMELTLFTNNCLVEFLDLAVHLQFGQSKEQQITIMRHYLIFIWQTLTIGHLLKVTGKRIILTATLD
jgi:hypothetical protein